MSMTPSSSRPDLRRLAETAAESHTTARLAVCELLVIVVNVAALAGALICYRGGSEWLAPAWLLTIVEGVSLLPLLVGAHWATVAHLSRPLPARR
jgi:hypothetical protein